MNGSIHWKYCLNHRCILTRCRWFQKFWYIVVANRVMYINIWKNRDVCCFLLSIYMCVCVRANMFMKSLDMYRLLCLSVRSYSLKIIYIFFCFLSRSVILLVWFRTTSNVPSLKRHPILRYHSITRYCSTRFFLIIIPRFAKLSTATRYRPTSLIIISRILKAPLFLRPVAL